MKYTILDLISELTNSWNSKQMLLSRGLGSIITGIALIFVIYDASIPYASQFNLFVAKGFCILFSFCLFLFGVFQLIKLIRKYTIKDSYKTQNTWNLFGMN